MNDDTSARVGAAPRMALAVTRGFEDYELIDSGGGRKRERFGAVTVDRPEPQAMWTRMLGEARWARADAMFVGEAEGEDGRWRYQGGPAARWPMRIKGITAVCRFSNFRHVGVFPEQLPLWEWMLDRLPRGSAEP